MLEGTGVHWERLGMTGTKARVKESNWNHVGRNWFILAVTGSTLGSYLDPIRNDWTNTGSIRE